MIPNRSRPLRTLPESANRDFWKRSEQLRKARSNRSPSGSIACSGGRHCGMIYYKEEQPHEALSGWRSPNVAAAKREVALSS